MSRARRKLCYPAAVIILNGMRLKAPAAIETQRLLLRRPRLDDAGAIFERYASDPAVTRYVGWPGHRSIADTEAFLQFSAAQWQEWPAGPYLIVSRADGLLLGGTGFAFETPHRAATGYVLARDAWGLGFATEALRAVVDVAASIGVQRLQALCHVDHRPSWRVLEKCGFLREGVLQRYAEFPNLRPGYAADVFSYARVFEAPAS